MPRGVYDRTKAKKRKRTSTTMAEEQAISIEDIRNACRIRLNQIDAERREVSEALKALV